MGTRLRVFSRKLVLSATAFILAVSGITAALPFVMDQEAGAINSSSAVVYDALPSVSPQTNYPSVGYEATSTSEFGDYVHLGGTNRKLNTVTVTMSDWAKYADYASNPVYSSNSSTWSLPVTLNVYSAAFDGNGVPTTRLATVTKTIAVPWRPASDPACGTTSNGTGWKVDGTCYNYSGIAFNAEFDLSSLNVTLPDDVVVGIAFNTQSHGYSPTGQSGPYNSLNVAVPAGQAVTTGSDNNTDEVVVNSTWSGQYGSAGSTGVFRKDTGWSPYGTVAMQITATAPLEIAACSATTTVNTTSLGTWYMGETRSTGHNELLANGLHIWTEGTTSTDKAAGYYSTNFPLANLGNQTIAESVDYAATTGITPGLQLAVDFDNNGSPDGYLVGESVYGNNWWLSNSAAQFAKDGAPHYGGGNGSSWFGTANEWLNAFPNAQVKAIGYSLGSGVHGDGVLNRITLGCTNYTFGLAAPTNLTPSNGTVTNDPAFVDTWSAVEGAHGYEYRTANTLNGSALGTIIYSDSTTSQPGRYSTNSGTVTRQNSGTPDGDYYWQVRAVDSVGNPGPWSTINKISVDTTAPAVPIHVSPANNALLNYNNFWFDWTDVSGAVSYEAQFSQSSSTDSNGSLNVGVWSGDASHNQPTDSRAWSSGATGTWYWQVRAVDAAGNKSAWSTPWKVTLDLTAPTTPTIITPLSEQYFKTTPIVDSWTPSSDANGIQKYQVEYIYDDGHTFSGGPYRDVSGSTTSRNHTPALTEQGGVTIRVRAVDNAGNMSDWSAPVHYYYDATNPTSSDNLGAALSGSVTATQHITDNIAAKSGKLRIWKLTAGVPDNSKFFAIGDLNVDANGDVVYHLDTINNLFGDGEYVAKFTATDKAGNAIVTQKYFVVDNTAPVVSLNSITAPTSTPTLTGNVNDSTAVVTLTVNGVDYAATNNGDGTWSYVFLSSLADGNYALSVVATDALGNVSSPATGTMTISTTTTTGETPEANGAALTTTATPTTTTTVLTTDGVVDGAQTQAGDGQTVTTGDEDANQVAAAGASDTKGATDGNGSQAGGLAWYWWLLIAALIAALWAFIAALRRRKSEQNQ